MVERTGIVEWNGGGCLLSAHEPLEAAPQHSSSTMHALFKIKHYLSTNFYYGPPKRLSI